MTYRTPRILALEPYAAPSHQAFLVQLAAHSQCEITPEFLPARYWKWRMGSAALHFAPRVKTGDWDILLVSDYMNLAELRGLLPAELTRRPALIYFHENQLTYPLQAGERRDVRFGFDHINSIAAADRALFNSRYHLNSLRGGLSELLSRVPDVSLAYALDEFDVKALVMPLGTNLPAGEPRSLGTSERPILLWNHRWEYDKDPGALVELARSLASRQVPYRLRLCGQRFRRTPEAFEELRGIAGSNLEDRGFLPTAEYMQELQEAHIVLSTAQHEFFGLGTLEAVRSGAFPVLPDDLAYPELLPDLAISERRRFLYPRTKGPLDTVLAAIRAIRDGEAMTARRAIINHTSSFSWPRLAQRYDDLFRELVS